MGPTAESKQDLAATSGWIASHTARTAIAGTLFVVLMALSWGLGAGPALAAGTATTVNVTFSPTSTIVADGVSTTTVTATALDSTPAGVQGDTIQFSSSDPGIQFTAAGGTTDVNGVYSTTITSSTVAHQVTITATDTTSGNLANTGTLTQTPGIATSVNVAMNPTSILANGSSTSTATATVSDANGNLVPTDTVAFSSSDAGNGVGGTTNHINGTYTATITSSTTVGTPVITATDSSAGGLHGQATLTQAAGPASIVTVALNPTSILADGASMTTATVTVTDAQGHLLTGQTANITSNDPNEKISPTPATDNGNGTYTATITASTTVGTPTIIATDGSASGTATLTQTVGQASNPSVTLNPTTILANGTSTTTATAQIVDAIGHPLANENVTFASSDPGEHVSAATNNGGGFYTATITSSTTVGTASITATDNTAGFTSPPATLTQTAGSAGRVLVAVNPGSLRADGASGAVATAVVTDSAGHPLSGEPIAFSSSDPGESVGPAVNGGGGVYTASITSSTTVGTASITATDPGTGAAGSATVTQTAIQTTSSLSVSNSKPTVGLPVTITTSVTPSHAGRLTVGGSVKFLDGAKTIASCSKQPLKVAGGSVIATCTVPFASRGSHTVSAHYSGNADFTGSTSNTQEVNVGRPGRLAPTMSWKFFFSPHYTKILVFILTHVPAGASVTVSCHGSGCPYSVHTLAIPKRTVCSTKSKKCVTQQPSSTVHLQPAFNNRRLGIGTTLIVEITRPGWVGKHYLFTVVSRHPPRHAIACLAPLISKPGIGC